ncbi:MAG TPA: hypothetical protein VH436_18720, partial [Vicinamibacterales bacterium]
MPEPLQLPPGPPPSRLRAFRAWLTGTFVGRAMIVGAFIKLVAFVITAAAGHSTPIDRFDSLGDIALVTAAVVLGYRVYIDTKRRLLWRVRRKLIVSYLFVGLVPVLLIISFFLVAGVLLFFNVSAYVLQNKFASLVDETRFFAESAALELQQAHTVDEVRVALTRRQGAAATRYPLSSYAIVPMPKRCTPNSPIALDRVVTAGGWSHVQPPRTIPEWIACNDIASLMTENAADGEHAFARAVTWPAGLNAAVIVDVPFDADLTRKVHDETGITVGDMFVGEQLDESAQTSRESSRPPPARSRLVIGPLNIGTGTQGGGVQSAAVVVYRDWATGETGR